MATARLPLLALRLRDIERFGGDWRRARDVVEKVLMVDPTYEAKVLSQPVPTLAKTRSPRKGKEGGSDSHEGVLGHFLLSVAFEEDLAGLFFAECPRAAPPPPEEQLSVERLSLHIERFKVRSWSGAPGCDILLCPPADSHPGTPTPLSMALQVRV